VDVSDVFSGSIASALSTVRFVRTSARRNRRALRVKVDLCSGNVSSYGGSVITAAGTDDRVAGLVYIAARDSAAIAKRRRTWFHRPLAK